MNINQNVFTCPKCGEETNKSNQFCSNCGKKLKEIYICTDCGREVNESDKFCPNCGEELNETDNSDENQSVVKPPASSFLISFLYIFAILSIIGGIVLINEIKDTIFITIIVSTIIVDVIIFLSIAKILRKVDYLLHIAG